MRSFRLPVSALVLLAILLFAGVGNSGWGSGEKIKPLMVLHGEHSKITGKRFVRITTADEWKALWTEHRTGSVNPQNLSDECEIPELDFDKVMAIAIFMSAAYPLHSITETPYEFDEMRNRCSRAPRISLRVSGGRQCPGIFTQALNLPITDHDRRGSGCSVEPPHLLSGDVPTQPWAVFILPRSDAEIVLEQDVRGGVDDPPKWERFDRIPAVERQHLTPERLHGGIGP